MAGILDEVMDGIAAKEKTNPETNKQPEPQKQTEQTPPKKETGGNPMNAYHDQFKEKYGEKK